MGWGGIENGALLAMAASHGFDALLTKDAGIEYEQNLTSLPIAVVLIDAASNDIDDIRPLLPTLLATLPAAVEVCDASPVRLDKEAQSRSTV